LSNGLPWDSWQIADFEFDEPDRCLRAACAATCRLALSLGSIEGQLPLALSPIAREKGTGKSENRLGKPQEATDRTAGEREGEKVKNVGAKKASWRIDEEEEEEESKRE